MPTYKNNSEITHKVKNTDNKSVSVKPGTTIETNKFISITDLTLLSDTPYYNRVVNRQTITLGAAQDVTISLETDFLIVIQITDYVTMYSQAAANTPPELENHTDDDPVIQIPCQGRMNNLVLTGSGTCEIIEYKE